jgi:hypothetical protein
VAKIFFINPIAYRRIPIVTKDEVVDEKVCKPKGRASRGNLLREIFV